MNYKEISVDWVKTTKTSISFISLELLFGILLLLGMPCSLVTAQGISNSSNSSNTGPDWFAKGYPYVHGVGIASYSSYNPRGSFSEAKKLAVQDLNASLMTSAHLESFQNTTQSIQQDFEFAIESYYDTTSAVMVDSAVVGRFAYYLVRPDTAGQMLPEPLVNAEQMVGDWTGDYFNPVKKNGYYIAAGFHRDSRYAPYKAWTKAKFDALNKLAHYISTNVQNRQKSFDSDYYSTYESLTYQYSKAIFRRIYTIERTKKDGNNVILLAIPDRYIYKYE